MTYATGIVAHVDRLDMANRLQHDIKADFINVDDGHLGPGTNHRIVWSLLSDLDTEWSVVFEDDALPVTGFRSQLDAALTSAPAPVISLYLGRQRPPQNQAQIGAAVQRADLDDAHWITASTMLHGVAIAMKTTLVADMLANLPDLPIDEAIGAWTRQRGHQIAYSWPSLVNHADVPTLVQHRDRKPRPPGRIAWRTGTRDSWSSASIDLQEA